MSTTKWFISILNEEFYVLPVLLKKDWQQYADKVSEPNINPLILIELEKDIEQLFGIYTIETSSIEDLEFENAEFI